MDPMESMSLTGSRIPAGFNAEDAGNMEDTAIASPSRLKKLSRANHDEQIEKQFAVKAVKYLKAHWRILEAQPASTGRLTKLDDEIYEHFRRDFPEVDPKVINEDEMKSKTGKERWRKFLMSYEKKIQDYNFGTILRVSAKDTYDQDNTILVPRMQFYAIEIARNRLKYNDDIFTKAEERRTKFEAKDKEVEAKRTEAKKAKGK
ncbi:DUF757 domain protein [Cordyceps fumosorosea ARSEF 2679]|uniref:DUF757 domain protein n=1 Tax=Cordyceps fumosorosea (strain ARSEF 2679) TaxID=1081104 RepID=A0A162LNP0_CORFA|nr:DUF757 domain protein [Cordyceps fumosorosea ARSEF 2679]OAA73394.1 DUF757 domain protein [Cordyceps fumosorosea ARSEF 2679]